MNARITRILSLSLTALMLGFGVTLTTFAQETPPPGGEPRDFEVPKGVTFTLDNGLSATLVSFGSVPKVNVLVTIRAGNVNESADEIWLADFAGDLIKEGTADRNASEIAEAAARLGGSVNISTGLDQTTVSGSVLSEFGGELVALLADVIQNPVFPEDEVPRIRRDRLRSLSIQQAQPGTKALVKFRELLHGDHPYGRLYPTEQQLEGYTADEARAFYDANWGAARTHVYVAGKFDVKKLRTAIERSFGDWRSGSPPVVNVPATSTQRSVHVVDIPGAVQSNAIIGLPVVDPSHDDYLTLQVANSLLGGSFASRITSNIREDKGYTYSPYSTLSSRYRDSYWAEIAAITTEVTGPAIREVLYEIERIQSEPPSAAELDGIKNYMAGTFVLQNSSASGIIAQLAYISMHGLPANYLNTYVQRIYAVTPEDIQRVSRAYFDPEKMLLVIAGDEAALAGQLTDFGPRAQ